MKMVYVLPTEGYKDVAKLAKAPESNKIPLLFHESGEFSEKEYWDAFLNIS